MSRGFTFLKVGKYADICTDEYNIYVKWLREQLHPLVGSVIQADVVACVIDYSIPSDLEHFEAVIRADPKQFSFVWNWNKRWRCEKELPPCDDLSVRMEMETMEDFNNNIALVVNTTLALGIYGDSDNIGVENVCEQFRANAATIRNISHVI
jgi:hypothetical protein